MIRFTLICEHEHEFEAWFASNEDFDHQQSSGWVSCPICESSNVEKTLMIPSIAKSSKEKNIDEDTPTETPSVLPDDRQRKIINKIRELRNELLDGAENVGDKFPEEARKIHYGESERKGIYGQADSQEVEELLDEGIPVAPLPILPEDTN